jgi:hypothetical protein
VEDEEKCQWCEKVWVGAGLVLGTLLIYVAIDVLLNGAVTRLWSPGIVEGTDDDGTVDRADD